MYVLYDIDILSYIYNVYEYELIIMFQYATKTLTHFSPIQVPSGEKTFAKLEQTGTI